MAKKFHFERAVFCALAVLTTAAFIVACGSGIPIDIEKDSKNIDSAYPKRDGMEDILTGWLQARSSSEEKSSSSEESSESSSSVEASSSSKGASNSSSNSSSSQQSSSSSRSGSSSSSPYELTCQIVTYTLQAGKPVPVSDIPVVKCKTKSSGATVTLQDDDVEWLIGTGKWSWPSPKAGDYTDFEIVVYDSPPISVDVCWGMRTTCKGTLKVISGSSVASSSSRANSSSAASTTPSSSSKASSSSTASTPSSSSAASGGGTGPCKVSGSSRYCKWTADGACGEINSQHDYISGENGCTAGNCTCDALIENCSKYGFLYSSSSCSGKDLNGKDPNQVTVLGCCNWGNNNSASNCWTIDSNSDNKECPRWHKQGQACSPNDGGCH